MASGKRKAPDLSTLARFRAGRCSEAVEDLFYQYVQVSEKQGEVNNGIPVTRAWYHCENCQNCPQREMFCQKQDVNAPKEVIMKETFWEKRVQSLENITNERGIQLRMNLSIQVESAFGLIKNVFGFHRFLTTWKKNVRIELLFLALGFNFKKRWMKQQKRRLEFHYCEEKAA